METTKTIDQAIAECAAHWAKVWNTDPQWIIRKAETGQTVSPERGWKKSRFSDWGTAEMVSRGLRALGKAINGQPSRQWMAIWMR